MPQQEPTTVGEIGKISADSPGWQALFRPLPFTPSPLQRCLMNRMTNPLLMIAEDDEPDDDNSMS